MKLREYQEEDVKFLAERDTAGCFNSPRTGKTPTSLMTVKAKGLDDKRILIITTNSALYQWQDEYRQWLDKPCLVCQGSKKQKEETIKQWTHGLIISLSSFKATTLREGFVDLILSMKPEMVILDEAHHIRNRNTCAAVSVFKLMKIKNRLALTGTPCYGEAQDIYSILHFLFPEVFNSYWRFVNQFLRQEQIWTGSKYINKPGTWLPGKEKIIQSFLSETCTQRKRKDVMPWLPAKDKQIVKLPLNKHQAKYLKELEDTYQIEGTEIETQGILDTLIRYRQICLDPGILELKGESEKTNWILDYITENPGTPIIIFSMFTSYLKKLSDILKERQIKRALIIGETPSEKRRIYQKDFQEGKFNIFLINTLSGQEALTLDRAEACIFTDIYPPVGSIEQAEDRFVATTEDKKSKPHAIYYLIMENSYDEQILKMVTARLNEVDVINNFKKYLKKGDCCE